MLDSWKHRRKLLHGQLLRLGSFPGNPTSRPSTAVVVAGQAKCRYRPAAAAAAVAAVQDGLVFEPWTSKVCEFWMRLWWATGQKEGLFIVVALRRYLQLHSVSAWMFSSLPSCPSLCRLVLLGTEAGCVDICAGCLVRLAAATFASSVRDWDVALCFCGHQRSLK